MIISTKLFIKTKVSKPIYSIKIFKDLSNNKIYTERVSSKEYYPDDIIILAKKIKKWGIKYNNYTLEKFCNKILKELKNKVYYINVLENK